MGEHSSNGCNIYEMTCIAAVGESKIPLLVAQTVAMKPKAIHEVAIPSKLRGCALPHSSNKGHSWHEFDEIGLQWRSFGKNEQDQTWYKLGVAEGSTDLNKFNTNLDAVRANSQHRLSPVVLAKKIRSVFHLVQEVPRKLVKLPTIEKDLANYLENALRLDDDDEEDDDDDDGDDEIKLFLQMLQDDLKNQYTNHHLIKPDYYMVSLDNYDQLYDVTLPIPVHQKYSGTYSNYDQLHDVTLPIPVHQKYKPAVPKFPNFRRQPKEDLVTREDIENNNLVKKTLEPVTDNEEETEYGIPCRWCAKIQCFTAATLRGKMNFNDIVFDPDPNKPRIVWLEWDRVPAAFRRITAYNKAKRCHMTHAEFYDLKYKDDDDAFPPLFKKGNIVKSGTEEMDEKRAEV